MPLKQPDWRNTPIIDATEASARYGTSGFASSTLPAVPVVASPSFDAQPVNWRNTPIADAPPIVIPAQDFNPHHDPHSGEFSSGGGGGGKQEKPKGKYHVRPEGAAQSLMTGIMKKGAENATFAEKKEVVMAQMTTAQMRRLREKGQTLSRSEVNNQFEARVLRERLSNAKNEKERRAIEKEYESSFEE